MFDYANIRRVLISFLHILIGWVLSTITIGIVYPQLLVRHQISHLRYQDLECDYMALFSFISNMYHGGIQLWNSYDQMPLMLYYMTGGLFSVFHIFGGMVYLMVSVFFDSPGKAFHVTASVVPFVISNLLVTIGTFLLVRRFSSRLIVLLLCMIIAGSLLSPFIYFGANGRHLVYFYPLVLHFVLCFFEDFRLNGLLLALVIMVVCVATSPFLGPGYFYQGVHFFILCALIWSIVRPDSITYRIFNRTTWRFDRSALVKIGITITFLMVVLIPLYILMSENYNDYWFGKEITRMQNKFSIIEYFKRPSSFAPKSDFLANSLDWSKGNIWWKSWQWLGFSTIFLSICGLIMNRDRRKFVFFGTIVLLLLVNGPKVAANVLDIPSFLAHAINALTNPGKFLVRSYHQPAAFAISFYLIPLIAMGLESIFSIAEKKQKYIIVNDEEMKKIYQVNSEVFKNVVRLLVNPMTTLFITCMLLVGLPFLLSQYSPPPVFSDRYSAKFMKVINIYVIMILLTFMLTIFSKRVQTFIIISFERFIVAISGYRQRLLTVGVVIFLIVSFVSTSVSKPVMLYLVISASISFVILILLARFSLLNSLLPILATLIIILFAIDFSRLSIWMQQVSSQVMMEKLTVPGLERFGKVVLDFQNPMVLPFRQYYNNDPIGQIPHYVIVNSINQQGVFYRYTNLGKLTLPGSEMHDSRHVSFEPIHEKRWFQDYLERDQRIFFQAQLAIKDSPGVFDEIIKKGLDRTIVIIDHVPPDQGPYATSLPNPLPQPLNPPQPQFHTLKMMLREARTTYEDELAIYWFDLPEGFPKYMTTSIFTRDSNLLKVKMSGKDFVPAQGKLVSPYTFDVQNIARNKLVVALPRKYKWHSDDNILFTYAAQNEIGITHIYQYESDMLEFDYLAKEDGWLVIHYPFDRKWKISIDGIARRVYKANYSFMTLPVREGNQRILIRYWPDTNLRFYIGLSYIVNFMALLIVTSIGIWSVTKDVSLPNEGGGKNNFHL